MMVKELKSAEFRQQIVPKMWCGVGYGSVGVLEMSSDRGRGGSRERLRLEDDLVERVAWMVKSLRRYLGLE